MARRRKGHDIHGWLILDKPQGITSNQALGRVKRLLEPKKAGHAGTLDPLATGLLPIALGEATKTVAFAMEGTKTYRFTVRWGVSTDTLDADGAEIARSDERPTPAAVEAALPAFLGEIQQVPPKYSAIKVDGERAYDLARDGEEVNLEARTVRIDRLALVETPDADTSVLDMTCGKGAYVRGLVRDLAAALGTEGHVSALRRLAVGPFSVETALDDIPALAVTGEDASRLKQGRAIVLLPHQAQELRERRRPRIVGGEDASRLALATFAGEVVALGDVRAGRFHPVRVFQL